MRRERADRLINDLVTTAIAINSDDQMLWRIDRLSVFGSYLTEKEVLGDLDIGFSLSRVGDPTDRDAVAVFLLTFPPPERVMRNWFERLCWPETYVRRRLRVGRNISFHDQSEIDTEGYPHRVIFNAALLGS